MRCKKCKGTGRIDNPQYPVRARVLEDRFGSGYITYDQYERELGRIFGRGEVPEETISCNVCGGLGRDLEVTAERGSP